ncbi:MAG: alpha/beta hydrolase [Halarsenatibacteraceae bacterium]
MSLKRKILITVVLIIIAGFTATTFFIGLAVFDGSTQITNPEGTSLASIESWLEANWDFNVDEFRSKYTIEKVELDSTSGDHVIPADYILADDNKNNDTVILVHGLGGNRVAVYPQARMFLENGYNVLAYDQRSSGENMAEHNTFGYLESNDLKDSVNYVREIIDNNLKLGVWGNSFGGATAGIYAGQDHADENLDFIILDSAISNQRDMISQQLEQQFGSSALREYMLFVGDLFTRFRLGYSYAEADVTNHIKDTELPVMLIYSRADQVTPYYMAEDIYNSIQHDKKEIFTVEGRSHETVYWDNLIEYETRVISFINEQTD